MGPRAVAGGGGRGDGLSLNGMVKVASTTSTTMIDRTVNGR